MTAPAVKVCPRCGRPLKNLFGRRTCPGCDRIPNDCNCLKLVVADRGVLLQFREVTPDGVVAEEV